MGTMEDVVIWGFTFVVELSVAGFNIIPRTVMRILACSMNQPVVLWCPPFVLGLFHGWRTVDVWVISITLSWCLSWSMSCTYPSPIPENGWVPANCWVENTMLRCFLKAKWRLMVKRERERESVRVCLLATAACRGLCVCGCVFVDLKRSSTLLLLRFLFL